MSLSTRFGSSQTHNATVIFTVPHVRYLLQATYCNRMILRHVFLQLLLDCGLGGGSGGEDAAEAVVAQHRVLLFCQLKSMLDIVEHDLLRPLLPTVSFLRLDGSVPAGQRHTIVSRSGFCIHKLLRFHSDSSTRWYPSTGTSSISPFAFPLQIHVLPSFTSHNFVIIFFIPLVDSTMTLPSTCCC